MRYSVALFRTVLTFVRTKPSMIFAQNPSLLLALLAVNYGRAFGIPVVVDSHNAGLFPSNGSNRLLTRVADHVIKRATLTLVTNDGLKKHVDQIGGTAFVLPDPLPIFDVAYQDRHVPLRGGYNVLFICTYAPDEPYLEVLKAARELNDSVVIYMTGHSKGRVSPIPKNVVLTGYLPDDEYIQLLHSVQIVIDLTSREDCLVCGAYEAVGAEKPLILSNTKALRDYFYKGALYVDNTSSDLVTKINESISKLDKLRDEVKELKNEIMGSWMRRKLLLENMLNNMNHDDGST